MSWRRIDLHLHTPASSDYQEPSATALDILRRAEERGLDIIAFTDHNSVRGYADMWREIEDLELLEYLKRLQPAEEERLRDYRRLLGKILLLPGFEFTARFGFHILAIFPEQTSVRMMEHLLLTLGVPEERFGSGEVGATLDALEAYELCARHGALVIGAHANSTHGIAMQGLRFGGQTKIAYTQDPNLHALEVTDLNLGTHRRSTARFFSGTKPEYPRRMHCIQGSDAHRLERDPERETNLGVGDRATEVLLPEISFAALKALFESDHFDRTRPYVPEPDDPVKAARLAGPSETLAFHESIASKRTGTSGVVRDVAALANSQGGVVFVGASASEKRPIAGLLDAATAAAEITQAIREQIAPNLEVEIETIVSDGKAVLAIVVPKGSERPYGLAGGVIPVRNGAESVPATRDEIVAMVRDLTGPHAPAGTAPSGSNGASGPSGGTAVVTGPPSVPEQRRRREAIGGPEPSAATAPVEASTERDEAERLESYEEPVEPDPIAPTTGVEVVDAFEQDGVTYYTLRDLRYHKLIHNVTRDIDRRLWRSAIEKRQEGEIDPATVRWKGDRGVARSYRLRGGDRRYTLVYRGDGFRTFYGVSEAGMTGEWSDLLPSANGAAGGGAAKR